MMNSQQYYYSNNYNNYPSSSMPPSYNPQSTYGGSAYDFARPYASANASAPPAKFDTNDNHTNATASFDQGDLIDLSDRNHNVPHQIVTTYSPTNTNSDNVSVVTTATAQPHPFTPELIQSQQFINDNIDEQVKEEQLTILADICRRNIQEQEDRLLAERLSGTSRAVVPTSSSRALVPHTTSTMTVPPMGTIDNPAPICAKKQHLKQTRPMKTAAGAVGGAVVGGLVLAPVAPLGVVLGGMAGGMATNKALKSKERKVQQRYEQGNFQLQAECNSPLSRQLREDGGAAFA